MMLKKWKMHSTQVSGKPNRCWEREVKTGTQPNRRQWNERCDAV